MESACQARVAGSLASELTARTLSRMDPLTVTAAPAAQEAPSCGSGKQRRLQGEA